MCSVGSVVEGECGRLDGELRRFKHSPQLQLQRGHVERVASLQTLSEPICRAIGTIPRILYLWLYKFSRWSA